jgi:hypothetical protein
MVNHGRSCAGCKNAAGRGKGCPLKTWMREKGVKAEDVEEDLIKADDDAKDMVLKEEEVLKGEDLSTSANPKTEEVDAVKVEAS